MSAYDDQLTSLRALAQSALDAVAGVSEDERARYREALERLEHILGFAVNVLASSDGDLLSDSAHQTVESSLQQCVNDPAAAVQNAGPCGSGILDAVAQLPTARHHDFAQHVRDAAANYQRSVQQRLNALNGDFAAAQDRVDAVSRETQAARAATDEQIKGLVQGFEAKLLESDQNIATHRALIEQAITSQAETFRDAQSARDAEFKAATDQRREDFDALVQSARREVDERVAEIRRMESESSALVGAIGLAGTAERYGEEVKEQRKAANTWRWITVALAMLAAVGVVVVALSLGSDPAWQEFTGKLTAGALFGGLATYAARQSARHREREERARSLQLELTAFSPFIEPLSAEQQGEERVLMTRRTFGKGDAEVGAAEEPGPRPGSLMQRRKQRETGLDDAA